MIYVFDTTCFKPLQYYYPDRFRSFWEKFDQCVLDGKIVSVREVHKELERYVWKTHMSDWIEENKGVFLKPNQDETTFVSQIFAVPHFQFLVKPSIRGLPRPAADPFVIACAKIKNGCVVTDEGWKPNAPKIPNVCKHFSIDCTNFEGFMERERWTF